MNLHVIFSSQVQTMISLSKMFKLPFNLLNFGWLKFKPRNDCVFWKKILLNRKHMNANSHNRIERQRAIANIFKSKMRMWKISWMIFQQKEFNIIEYLLGSKWNEWKNRKNSQQQYKHDGIFDWNRTRW